MAFLLGNESCIQTLRNDLADIQEAIDEILVRTGAVKCYSWKSPDKLASDLKVKDLLDRYQFGSDEVENQVAHYSLLELIVDRLLLLAHISTNSIDSALSLAESSGSNSKITRLSAGLVVKKYWNKMTQVCSTVRQLNNQVKTAPVKQKADDSVRSSRTNSISATGESKNGTPSRNKKDSISEEVSSKSVQTNETAFVPCEACAKVQANLKQNADQIINMCHYQNLNSMVGKYRSSLSNGVQHGWLNGSDLDKWLTEQDKDLARIAKQLEFITTNNKLLKDKLAENELNMQKVVASEKETKKSLKEEQELRTIQMKQYEKKLSDQKTEMQSKITSLEGEVNRLSQLKSSLEQKNEQIKQLNDKNEKIIVELNETNKILSEEVAIKNNQFERLQKLEEERVVINKELEWTKKELSEKSAELNNERSKLENLIRNEQSMKLKHDSAMDTLDKLTADNENSKKRLGYVDEEKKQLIENIKTKETQLESLQFDNEILQNSLNNLKEEMNKVKHSQLLLLKYPDLYGPMEHLSVEGEQETNVYEDMLNQMNANKERIRLLDELNKKLENSMNRLKQVNGFRNDRSQSSESRHHSMRSNGGGFDTSEHSNYFMKAPESSSRRSSISQEKPPSSRPYPLYKLESELEDANTSARQSIQIGKQRTQSQTKLWSQEDSLPDDTSNKTGRSISNERIYQLPPHPDHNRTRLNSSASYHNTLVATTPSPVPTPIPHSTMYTKYGYDDLQNDEELDFLKDKHKSDRNYLNKLNQIAQASELGGETSHTDYTQIVTKITPASGRRRVSGNNSQASTRDHLTSPFLYNPSASSSRAGSGYSRRVEQVNSTRATPPIPPADKNMEMVVGKGRRSAAGSGAPFNPNSTSSARSNSAGLNSGKPNGKAPPPVAPPSGRHSTHKESSEFKCEICSKKYDNSKDLSIHKLYCTN